jgi:hypothetical protein
MDEQSGRSSREREQVVLEEAGIVTYQIRISTIFLNTCPTMGTCVFTNNLGRTQKNKHP